MKSLSPSETKAALTTTPAWSARKRVIRRTFEFPNFVTAMKFVNAIARAAEKAQHHPDIEIRWNRVALVLTTHDAGGLTRKDFALAGLADVIAAKLIGR